MATNTQINDKLNTALGFNNAQNKRSISINVPNTFEEKQQIIKNINSDYYRRVDSPAVHAAEQCNHNEDNRLIYTKLLDIEKMIIQLSKSLDYLDERIHRIEDRLPLKIAERSATTDQTEHHNVPKEIWFPENITLPEARGYIPTLKSMYAKNHVLIKDMDAFFMYLKSVESAVARGNEVALAEAWNRLMHTITGNTASCIVSFSLAGTAGFVYTPTVEQFFSVLIVPAFVSVGKYTMAHITTSAFLDGTTPPVGEPVWVVDAWLDHTAVAVGRPNGIVSGTSGACDSFFALPQVVIVEPEDTASRPPAYCSQFTKKILPSDLFSNGTDFGVSVYMHFRCAPLFYVSSKTFSIRHIVVFTSDEAYVAPRTPAVFDVNLESQDVPISVNVSSSVTVPVQINSSTIVQDVNVQSIDTSLIPLPTTVSNNVLTTVTNTVAVSGALDITGDVTIDPTQLPLPVSLNGNYRLPPVRRHGTYNEYGHTQLDMAELMAMKMPEPMLPVEIINYEKNNSLIQELLKNEMIAKQDMRANTTEKESAKSIKIIQAHQPTIEKQIRTYGTCPINNKDPWFNIYNILLQQQNSNDCALIDDFINNDEIAKEMEEKIIDDINSSPNQKRAKPAANNDARRRQADANKNTMDNRNAKQIKENNPSMPEEQKNATNKSNNSRNMDNLNAKDERAIKKESAIQRLRDKKIRNMLELIVWVINHYQRTGTMPGINFYHNILDTMTVNVEFDQHLYDLLDICELLSDFHAILMILNPGLKHGINDTWMTTCNNSVVYKSESQVQALQDAIKQGYNPYGNGMIDALLEQIAETNEKFGLPPLYSEPTTPIGEFLTSRYILEKAIYDHLAEGNMLTASEANTKLKEINDTVGVFDGILTKLINTPKATEFVGPSWTGGRFGSVDSISDLATLMLIQPKSKLDELARMHDLIYKTTKDKEKIRLADEIFRDGIRESLEGELPLLEKIQGAAAKSAFETKNAFEDVRSNFDDYLDRLWGTKDVQIKVPTKNGKILHEGYNMYGNTQMSLTEPAVIYAAIVTGMKETKERTTIMGFRMPGPTTINAGIDTTVHDAYFEARGKTKMQRAIQNVQFSQDIPIDGYTALPVTITNDAGNAELAVINNTLTKFQWTQGTGPELTRGPIAIAFLDTAEIKTLVNTLKLSTAVISGPEAYRMFTEIDYSGSSVPSATVGSNAYMLAEVMHLRKMCDVNANWCFTQNIMDRVYHKPNIFGAAALSQTYAAFVNIRMWTMTLNGYSQYLSGIQSANPLTNGYPGAPIFIFMTSEMMDPVNIRSRWIYILAHLPPSMFTVPLILRRKRQVGANANVASNLSDATMDIGLITVGGNPGIDLVLVYFDPNPAPGALGQAARNWAFDMQIPGIGAAYIASTNAVGGQNWYEAASAPVNGLVNMLAAIDAFRAAPNSTVFDIAIRWLYRFYLDKNDIVTAKLQNIITDNLFVNQPAVTSDQGFNGIYHALFQDDYAGVIADFNMTANNYNQWFGQKTEDCFGIRKLPLNGAGAPVYQLSQMPHARRAALIYGLLKITDPPPVTQYIPSTCAYAFENHELSCAIRTMIDDTISGTGTTSWAFQGNSRTASPFAQFQKEILDRMFFKITTGLNIVNRIGMNATRFVDTLQQTPIQYWMYTRKYIQSCWLGSKFDIKRPQAMTRKIERSKGSTITTMIQPPLAAAALGTVFVTEMERKGITDFWLPRAIYTNAVAVPVPLLEMRMQEEGANSNSGSGLNVLIPSSNSWAALYLGVIATFDARVQTATIQNLMSAYTTQPSCGFELGRKLLYGWTAPTDGALSDVEPIFECYNSVNQTLNGYMAQQIVQNAELAKLADPSIAMGDDGVKG